jgi:hypothetical protein
MTVVRDSIAYYGTYAVDEAGRSLSVKLDGSTYANLLVPRLKEFEGFIRPLVSSLPLDE